MNWPSHNLWVIASSFVVALLLSLLPLPNSVIAAKPEWVLMVLLYWSISMPQRVGISAAWLLGLFLDVLRGSVLGQHTLALSVVTYISLAFAHRLKVFSLAKQAAVVALLVLLYLLVRLWINSLFQPIQASWSYWLPALTSALLWPWLFIILRDIRRYFNLVG
jgi:rod shape-determining protein MreD